MRRPILHVWGPDQAFFELSMTDEFAGNVEAAAEHPETGGLCLLFKETGADLGVLIQKLRWRMTPFVVRYEILQ